MTKISLSLLVLKTNQLGNVKAFYETLGMSFVEEQHGVGPVHFSSRFDGTVLEIYPLAAGEPDTTTRLGFVVDDLTDVMDSLYRGEFSQSKVPKQTEWGLRVVVKDPDGRSVELYQRNEVGE